MSEDSSSDSDNINAYSAKFDPLKALYSDKVKVPVPGAPVYENLKQFECALKNESIIPVGYKHLVQQRDAEKARKKEEEERALEEKNKQRFAQYEAVMPTRERKQAKNVLTRMETIDGPLGALKECVDQRLRVKVVTRNATGIRGVLHANLVAFDKQWNLALTDVLEIWKRKGVKKRKTPVGLGTPVPAGTAASRSFVPAVTETPAGSGVWECTRHLPQVLVRGEHVVLVNIVER